jgi:hypothetical protein
MKRAGRYPNCSKGRNRLRATALQRKSTEPGCRRLTANAPKNLVRVLRRRVPRVTGMVSKWNHSSCHVFFRHQRGCFARHPPRYFRQRAATWRGRRLRVLIGHHPRWSGLKEATRHVANGPASSAVKLPYPVPQIGKKRRRRIRRPAPHHGAYPPPPAATRRSSSLPGEDSANRLFPCDVEQRRHLLPLARERV